MAHNRSHRDLTYMGREYYVSNAGAETPSATRALVACARCRVEEFLEDGKSYLGMAQYETRS